MFNQELKEWSKVIESYPKISFLEARSLYLKLINSENKDSKRKIRDNLILSTLYIVLNFILDSGLIHLTSSSYDISDIISTCNEIFIDKIDSGCLLKINSFKDIFDSNFYKELMKKLNIVKYSLGTIDLNTFIDLLIKYLDLTSKDSNLDYYKLLDCLKENNYYLLELFKAIIKSLKIDDITLSKTKLLKLKYMLISNGLEYLRIDIDKISYADFTDTLIDRCYFERIVEILRESSSLDEFQKEIIIKRFGLVNGNYHTLDELANEYNISREKIKQIIIRALRKLRQPEFVKKIKDLI